MVNIMIVSLPRSVRVRTIVRENGYLPMHQHTIVLPFIILSYCHIVLRYNFIIFSDHIQTLFKYIVQRLQGENRNITYR